VSPIINGTFAEVSENHGKPVYKKEGPEGVALIYFWDDRDGPNFCGWWFGPVVGGDQVWAYNANTASSAPPTSGWKVPWDGPEDPNMVLTYMQAGMPPAGPPPPGPPPSHGYGEGYPGYSHHQEAWDRSQEQRWQEDQAIRDEQNAVWAVREVIQKLRMAQPETLEDLKAEYEKVKSQNLDWMRSSVQQVEAEAEQALVAAKERVEEIAQKRQEDEKKRKEDEARTEKLSQEVAEEVAQAEAKVSQVDEAARPLVECVEDPKRETKVDSAEDIEKDITSLRAVLDSLSSSLSSKKSGVASTEFGRRKLREEWSGHFSKLAKCRRRVAHLKASAEAFRELSSRKVAAARDEKECLGLFEKYDADKDGFLSKEEAQAFAAAEFKYELGAKQLDQLFTSLAKGLAGVPREKMYRLRTLVAVFKSEVEAREYRAKIEERERKRREEEAKRREELARKREELKKEFESAQALLTEAGTSALTAEAALPIVTEAQTCSQLRRAASDGEAALDSAKEKLSKVSAAVDECSQEKDSDHELKRFQSDEIARFRALVKHLTSRLDRVAAACVSARTAAQSREGGELERLQDDIILALRQRMTTEGKSTVAELYDTIVEGSNDGMTCEKFCKFITAVPDDRFSDAPLEKLFNRFTEDGAVFEKAAFEAMLSLSYKVVGPTVMTEGIKADKVVGKVELGQVVELLEGPVKEEELQVMRIRGRITVGDTVQEGWVSIAGNQGSIYLELHKQPRDSSHAEASEAPAAPTAETPAPPAVSSCTPAAEQPSGAGREAATAESTTAVHTETGS